METRRKRRGEDDVDMNAGDTAAHMVGTPISVHSNSPNTRKRPFKLSRGKNGDVESETESYDEDKCNHEMLQKRLKSVTDEKEIKRLKRLLRNRVSAQQARERKKQYINDLEQQLQDKESALVDVKSKLQDVTSDNMTLRRLITTMRGANTQVSHPANSSCTPAPGPSLDKTPAIHNAQQNSKGETRTWHLSEVPQDD
eukprot:jgi/Ulvmu1/7889/UM004_0120.1